MSREAAAASRLAWAATNPGVDGEPIHAALADYLRATREQEWHGSSATEGDDPEVAKELAQLERVVRAEAARSDLTTAQTGELLAALDTLTSERRARIAAGSRTIPVLIIVTLIASGVALIANGGALLIRSGLRTVGARRRARDGGRPQPRVAVRADRTVGWLAGRERQGDRHRRARPPVGVLRAVSLLLAVAIVVVCTAVAVTLMLLVRRRAPEGSYFADGDRAAGVFGVLATGFSVLLGFVVFLAFTSYDAARAGAEDEARLVAQQVETAQFLSTEHSAELTGDLVCYARSVAGIQWERMENHTLGDDLNPWSVALYRTLRTIDPETPVEQAAYSKWLDQTSDREDARSSRIHGARGVIPTPLWVVLFFAAVVIVGYMLLFADSAERALVQGVMMGAVVALIVSMLLLLQFLNNPFHGGVGGLRPVAMERTLRILDDELKAGGIQITPPCDALGNTR